MMRRFWDMVTRFAAPFAVFVVVLAVVLAVNTAQSNRTFSQCIQHWASSYVSASTERADAHDSVQMALDSLIRAIPSANTPGAAASFEHALSEYIAASNSERASEKKHPLPAAPTLECSP